MSENPLLDWDLIAPFIFAGLATLSYYWGKKYGDRVFLSTYPLFAALAFFTVFEYLFQIFITSSGRPWLVVSTAGLIISTTVTLLFLLTSSTWIVKNYRYHRLVSQTMTLRGMAIVAAVVSCVVIFHTYLSTANIANGDLSYTCEDGAYFTISFVSDEELRISAQEKIYIFTLETRGEDQVRIFGNSEYAITFASTYEDSQIVFTHRNKEGPYSTICHKSHT